MKTRLDGRRQDVAADLETSVDEIRLTHPPSSGTIRDDARLRRHPRRHERRGNQPRRGPHGGRTRRKGARVSRRREHSSHSRKLFNTGLYVSGSGSHGTHACQYALPTKGPIRTRSIVTLRGMVSSCTTNSLAPVAERSKALCSG